MSEINLFYGLETCARVTMTALEEIGVDFTTRRIDLAKDEHKSADYLAINPNGEVPALTIAGRTLIQNAAILHFLDAAYPAAGLLPKPGGLVGINEPLEDLLWCSSTLHILRRQVLNAGRFASGHLEGVREKGLQTWGRVMPRIERRLAERLWWYGDEWSIVDVYLNWSFSGLMAEWLDIPSKPILLDHESRLNKRPSYVRAIARERDGLTRVPGPGEVFSSTA